MLDEQKDNFFQVEMNLFSAAGGSTSQGTRSVHTRLSNLLEREERFPKKLRNIEMVTEALYNAALLYGKLGECVIVTVANDIGHSFDQDVYTEFLAERGIRNPRYSFKELENLTKFDEETGIITV